MGGGEHVNVNDNDSCREIPMDKNSVPEEKCCSKLWWEQVKLRGWRRFWMVEGHNRSSGEVGESCLDR